jgi:hypothetical protein
MHQGQMLPIMPPPPDLHFTCPLSFCSKIVHFSIFRIALSTVIDDRDEAPQYAKDAIWHGLVSQAACGAEIRKKERTTDLVIQAVKSGFRGIDTACQPKVRLSDSQN